MRAITDQIELEVSPDVLFQTLVTPTEIMSWWQAKTAIVLAKENGIWAATWGENIDQPDYIVAARILSFDPPSRMLLGDFQYVSKDGPLPFEANIQTEYVVGSTATGARLVVNQSGFPDIGEADEYYQGCVAGWRTTLEGIENFLAPGN